MILLLTSAAGIAGTKAKFCEGHTISHTIRWETLWAWGYNGFGQLETGLTFHGGITQRMRQA
jgi:hypothetical protein